MSTVYAFLLGLGIPIVSISLAAVEVAFAFSFNGHVEESTLISAIVLAIGVWDRERFRSAPNSTRKAAVIR